MFIKSSYPILILALIIFVLISLIWTFSWLLFFLLVALFIIYKNPNRELVCTDKKAILAPVDGKIIALKNITHQDLGECIELCIKNSFYEPGLIRACGNWQVLDIKQRHGLFLPSSFELSSSFNERVFILAKQEEKTLALRVSAGSLDRKIQLYPKKSYKAGEALGFSFNASLSLLVPRDSRLLVLLGDKIKANALLGYLS